MKLRMFSLLALISLLTALWALPVLAEDRNVTLPSSHEEVIDLLLDGAPHMSFTAAQNQVKFQVSEELRGKPLRVYHFRANIHFLYRSVEDVTSDAEGYISLTLPYTGDFVVADLPYEVKRLVLDLRYMDQSLWEDCKTPSQPFDTDRYPIPAGEWVSSAVWREQQGLEPLVAPDEEVTDTEEPELPGETAQNPGETLQGADESTQDTAGMTDAAGPNNVDVIAAGNFDSATTVLPVSPETTQSYEVPWLTYLVVAIFIGLGVLISRFLRSW